LVLIKQDVAGFVPCEHRNLEKRKGKRLKTSFSEDKFDCIFLERGLHYSEFSTPQLKAK
jgi:hypothetical protein